MGDSKADIRQQAGYSELEYSLGIVRDKAAELRKNISKNISQVVSHNVPDRVPEDFGDHKLKFQIPFDYIDPKEFSNVWGRISHEIAQYKELRDQEARLLLSMGVLDVKGVVPE